MNLAELDNVCRGLGLRVAVDLVDETCHTVRDWPHPGAYLRVRVLDEDGEVLAGRVQSDGATETLDELAAGTLETLLRKLG